MNYIVIISDRHGLGVEAIGPVDYDTHIRIGKDASEAGNIVVGYPCKDAAFYQFKGDN